MPTFEVTDNKTGKIVTFDWAGEGQPTEGDIQNIFKDALEFKGPNTPSSPSSSIWDQVKGFAKDFGKATLEQAPTIGATVGALAGGVPGLVTGPGSIPLAIGGATIGGMTGERLKQALGPYVGVKAPDPLSPEGSQASANQGLLGMMSEMGGQMATPVLNKIMAPFASRMTPEAQKISQIATEQNLPISTQTINPSLPGKIGQSIIDKMPVVSLLTNRYRGKLQTGLNDIAETARAKYSNEAIAQMEAETLQKYGGWLKGVQQETVDMENSLSALHGVYENLPKNAKKTADTIFLSAGEGTELPIAAIEKLKNQMGTLSRGNIDVRQTLNKAMREDIAKVEGGEEAVKALNEADKLYRLEKASRDINGLFKASMKSDGVTETFMPLNFIQKYTPEFRKKISRDAADIIPQLDEILIISKAAKDDISKVKGFDTAQKIASWAIPLGGAGAMQYFDVENKAPYLLPLAAGLGLSKSMMSPGGWTRKWLTEGLKSGPGTQLGLKLGGRALTMGKE
jgi:hypothetical protein